MKIKKDYLNYDSEKTNVMYFLPGLELEILPTFILLTHGYTSDKSSILNWAIRLAESGASVALFDLPGHYQGNYSEVNSFIYFKNNAHKLFTEAFFGLFKIFKDEFPLHEKFLAPEELRIVFGGHSLGALLALKAMAQDEFLPFQKRGIGVGLGMAPKDMVHLFDTPFYKSTLNIREQLVSPELKPENVFPWIRNEKKDLEIKNQDIHLITGEDDLVVGEDGLERFKINLEEKNNRVTIERPTKLPHHEPNMAASYVKKYLKKIHWI